MVLLLPFQFGFLIYFSCLIVVARTSNTVVREGILVYFLILQKMLSAFHHSLWCLAVVLSYMPLIMLRYIPSIFTLLRVFVINCCWILSKSILASIKMIIWLFILHFVSVVYLVDSFTDIEAFLHAWDRAHLIMVYDLFNILLNWFANSFLRNFPSIFSSDIWF